MRNESDIRYRIKNAGIEAFSEKGVEGATVGSILKRAEIARATFYRYFESKYELYYELIEDYLDGVYDLLKQVFRNQPTSEEDFCKAIYKHMIKIYEKNMLDPRLSQIFNVAMMSRDSNVLYRIERFNEKASEHIGDLLKKGIEKKIFRKVDVIEPSIFCKFP